VTPELQRLREEMGELLDAIALEIAPHPNWEEPSDTSYLTEQDRANPDIMANIEAMLATNSRIAWFGKDEEGFVGLWRGTEDRPLPECPVLRLDTEGQYTLIARTIADYILLSFDDEQWDIIREMLTGAGFAVAESPKDIEDSLGGLEDPNAFRHQQYNAARQNRGLEPVP